MSITRKKRQRGGWTSTSLDYIKRVQEVIEGLRDYWPLTLRQVYYQLVAAGDIENNLGQYKKLSRLLTKARLDDLVPWAALEDRVRSVLHSAGWADQAHFVEHELEDFLRGYRRDLLQSQALALELWIEKDALSRVCHRVALPYCVPVVVARGFSSVSYLHEARKRIERHAESGRNTLILYFGDLDPSGWEMLPAMLETLQDEMKLKRQVTGKRYALTPEQVYAYNLPRSIDAMKDADSRTPRYRAMLRSMGHPDDLAVELDALPPATLEALVAEAIEENLDLSQLRREQAQEAAEHGSILDLRSKIADFLDDEMP